MDGWVRVLRPFNSISVTLRRWKDEHERLCAMKRRLGSGRISPPAGFEPATPWTEIGIANRSATRTLLIKKKKKKKKKNLMWATSWENLSSGVCDQVWLKPACSETYTCKLARVLKFRTTTRGVILSRQRTTKALSDQTGCMRRLICVFIVRMWHKLVWACRGSNVKRKKINNDQELIQSDPTSCPQNQKGNN